jgi:hypothetical protein
MSEHCVTDSGGVWSRSTVNRNACIGCDTTCRLDIVRGMCSKCYMRDWRARRRVTEATCESCRIVFPTSRRDAKFCSNRCRQQAHRGRAAIVPVREFRCAALW